MSLLHDTQRAFAQAMTEGRPHAVAAMIATGPSAHRSVALYRRLIRTNYIQVLSVTYPTLARFVGDHAFHVLARGYLKRHPSRSGDLFAYGRHLPSWLDDVQAPPLVTALARLDWACHEIHQAQDAPPLSPDRLQALVEADPSRVTVRIRPAVRVLRFPFPVHRVWLALQPGSCGEGKIELPLPHEETVVLVSRGGGTVQVTDMDLLDARLVEAMAEGATLADVERMAIAAHPEFDFQRWWASLLNLGVIGGCSIEEVPWHT